MMRREERSQNDFSYIGRKINLSRFFLLGGMDQKMIVVVHKAISMDLHPEHPVQIPKQFQKHTTLMIVVEDGSIPTNTIHHMVPSARELNA